MRHHHAIMKALADRITIDLDQRRGRPCVRGTRFHVPDVLDLLAKDQELPNLERDDTRPCLAFLRAKTHTSALDALRA